MKALNDELSINDHHWNAFVRILIAWTRNQIKSKNRRPEALPAWVNPAIQSQKMKNEFAKRARERARKKLQREKLQNMEDVEDTQLQPTNLFNPFDTDYRKKADALKQLLKSCTDVNLSVLQSVDEEIHHCESYLQYLKKCQTWLKEKQIRNTFIFEPENFYEYLCSDAPAWEKVPYIKAAIPSITQEHEKIIHWLHVVAQKGEPHLKEICKIALGYLSRNYHPM
jgi:hypothetical protein